MLNRRMKKILFWERIFIYLAIFPSIMSLYLVFKVVDLILESGLEIWMVIPSLILILLNVYMWSRLSK